MEDDRARGQGQARPDTATVAVKVSGCPTSGVEVELLKIVVVAVWVTS